MVPRDVGTVDDYCLRERIPVKLSLPWPDKALSPNARVHWAVKSKAAKAYRAWGAISVKLAHAKIDWDGVIHAFITFYPPDKRQRDDDNLIAAFKSARDGIADALGVDDKRFRIHPYLSDEVRKGGAVEVVLVPHGIAFNSEQALTKGE